MIPSVRTHSFKSRALVGIKFVAARVVGWIPSHYFRLFAYRRIFRMSIGTGTTLYRNPELHRPSAITIGKNTIIGKDAILDGRCGLTIGDNVNFSSAVWIWTLQHDVNSPDFGGEGEAVVIGDRAWLSCRTTVLPGVNIGEGAVVCAGAVVTSDVEPFTVVAGVPARKIGERNRELNYTLQERIPFL